MVVPRPVRLCLAGWHARSSWMQVRGTNAQGSAPTACRHPDRRAGNAPCVSSFSPGHRGASTHECPLLEHPRGSTARRPTRSVLTGGSASSGPSDADPVPHHPPPGVANRTGPHQVHRPMPTFPTSSPTTPPTRTFRAFQRAQTRADPSPRLRQPSARSRRPPPPCSEPLGNVSLAPSPVLRRPQRGVTDPSPRPRKLPARCHGPLPPSSKVPSDVSLTPSGALGEPWRGLLAPKPFGHPPHFAIPCTQPWNRESPGDACAGAQATPDDDALARREEEQPLLPATRGPRHPPMSTPGRHPLIGNNRGCQPGR